MRFRVAKKYHGLHPSSIASWLTHNCDAITRCGNYMTEVTMVPRLLCDELTDWLEGRSYHCWWYDGPGATWLEVELPDADDALMYKLAWGGA